MKYLRLFASLLAACLVVSSHCFTGCGRKPGLKNADSVKVVVDIDGNEYHPITMGRQIWMLENLRVTHYRNGNRIAEIPDDSAWEKTEKGGCCVLRNDEKMGEVFGKLYNWHAVADNRGLCPVGWHVPADMEWQELADFLGGDKVAGEKMKEAGSAHWASPNAGATNLSGFTALPGGGRDETGKFIIDKYGGHWWSTTEDGSADVWVRSIYYGYGSMLRDSYNKNSGFSVRCLHD